MIVPYYQTQKRGFTLIELSLVLVIIGLIVGGILVGKELINAAKLRKVASEVEQFNTARNTFRLKYNAIAGDMGNATQFFGTKMSCDGVSNIDVHNGNGDGVLWSTDYSGEVLYAWQDLGLAGLIENCYSGSSRDTLTGIYPDGTIVPPYGVKTIPRSALATNVGYSFVTPNGTNFTGNGIYGKYGVFLWLGAMPDVASVWNSGKAISASNAYSIDAKIDDGIARSGKVLTGKGWDFSGNCVTPSAAFRPQVSEAPAAYATTDYVKTNTDIDCAMMFHLE